MRHIEQLPDAPEIYLLGNCLCIPVPVQHPHVAVECTFTIPYTVLLGHLRSGLFNNGLVQ